MIGKFNEIVLNLVDIDNGEVINSKKVNNEEEYENVYRSFTEEVIKYDEDLRIEKLNYIECDCGKKVLCNAFTNTCSCGIDYSLDGSALADRSQWGEETGERWEDIY